MKKNEASAENVFLRTIFRARTWENYLARETVLSSSDPEDWKSIEFPLEVALELTNYCNLRCIMCPVPHLRRNRGFMGKDVFKKVVSDLSGESGFLFLPQGFGESLLHPDWARMIDFARAMKTHPIVVLTNGMLLDEEKIAGLLHSVDAVVVAMDGITPETYASIRVNGSLNTITKNIEHFLRMRKDSATPRLVVRIIRMRDTEEEIERFRLLWSRKIGQGDTVHVSDCIDWAGHVPYRGIAENQLRERRCPCRMLWKNLTVYHDGKVSPCCYDAEGELIVGDVLTQSTRELWHASPLNNLRALHLAGQYEKIPICSRCRNWH